MDGPASLGRCGCGVRIPARPLLTKRREMKVKKIIMPHGSIGKLAAMCGVSTNTVREALNFGADTEAQRLVRKRAVELYGGQVVTIEKTL